MTKPPSAIFTQIGVALSTWSQVEMGMTSLFTQISDMRNSRKAIALFDGIINFELRLAILDRMMAFERIDDEVEREMWARFSARLSKAYKKRHQLAHFGIVLTDDEIGITPFLSVEMVVNLAGEPPAKLTEKQITFRVARFLELFHGFNWFMAQAARRRATPETNPQPAASEQPFVARLRELASQTLEARKRQPKEPPPADNW